MRREFYSEATPSPPTLMSVEIRVSHSKIMKRDPGNGKGERLEGKKHTCAPQKLRGVGVFRGSGLAS